jgi:hypothetical protein
MVMTDEREREREILWLATRLDGHHPSGGSFYHVSSNSVFSKSERIYIYIYIYIENIRISFGIKTVPFFPLNTQQQPCQHRLTGG